MPCDVPHCYISGVNHTIYQLLQKTTTRANEVGTLYPKVGANKPTYFITSMYTSF